MSKRKILITSIHMGLGGIESVLINFLQNINYNLYEVDLVLYKKIGYNLKKIPAKVNVYSPYSYSKKLNFLEKLTIKDSFLNKLIRKITFNNITKKIYVSNKKYDIGIAFAGYHYLMDSFISMSNCNKKYIWVHTDIKYLLDNNVKYSKKFYKTKFKYNSFDKIITVSKSVLDGFVFVFPEYKNKTNYIWNILPSKMPGGKVKLSNKFNIVSVGRLELQKGYERLVDIVDLLIKENKDFHIYIIGNGSEKTKLLDKLKDMKLEKYIDFLGAKEEVFKYLNSADLFLSTSYFEGFCTAVIEALLCSLPVVAPNVTGIVDIANEIAPIDSFILTNNDINSIKDGIIFAMKGKINKKFKFTSQKINREIIKKYTKLLEGKI